MKCLISAAGEAVDRDKLLKQVWNYSSDVTTHTLENPYLSVEAEIRGRPIDPAFDNFSKVAAFRYAHSRNSLSMVNVFDINKHLIEIILKSKLKEKG
ncbi:MAG: hypothetical protein ACJ0DF_12350 [Paracoccaceae bacterium]